LQFSRHPRELDEALLGSSAAICARNRGVDTRPAWANGAKVFVDGLGQSLLAEAGVSQLLPRHVLVSVEDEDSVHAAMQTLSYRIRPRLKPGFGRRVLGRWVNNASGNSDLFRNASDTEGEEGSPRAEDATAEDASEDASPDLCTKVNAEVQEATTYEPASEPAPPTPRSSCRALHALDDYIAVPLQVPIQRAVMPTSESSFIRRAEENV
jgi:hypothetical protein